MRKTLQHLDDEHMQLYEWSGAGMVCIAPEKSKRTHSWHASYSVLAVMTSLLVLSGCNSKNPAESASQSGVGDIKIKEGSLNEEATSKPAAAESSEAAGHAMGKGPAEQLA